MTDNSQPVGIIVDEPERSDRTRRRIGVIEYLERFPLFPVIRQKNANTGTRETHLICHTRFQIQQVHQRHAGWLWAECLWRATYWQACPIHSGLKKVTIAENELYCTYRWVWVSPIIFSFFDRRQSFMCGLVRNMQPTSSAAPWTIYCTGHKTDYR